MSPGGWWLKPTTRHADATSSAFDVKDWSCIVTAPPFACRRHAGRMALSRGLRLRAIQVSGQIGPGDVGDADQQHSVRSACEWVCTATPYGDAAVAIAQWERPTLTTSMADRMTAMAHAPAHSARENGSSRSPLDTSRSICALACPLLFEPSASSSHRRNVVKRNLVRSPRLPVS
jgi:hypothetical protein